MDIRNFKFWDKQRGAVGNLIVVFIAVWVLSLVPILDRFFDAYFAFHPLPQGIVMPWGFVTYMFVHQGFFHMLSNALWLYFIGILLQDLVGDKVLLKLFFWGGFFGSVCFQLFYSFLLGPESRMAFDGLVGASGGVSAVVIGTALFSPYYRVFLFGIVEVELRWIAIAKVVLDIAGAMGNANQGGFICHLGGILFAVIYVYGYMKGNMPGWMDEMFLSLESIFGSGNRKRKSVMAASKQAKQSRSSGKSSSDFLSSMGISDSTSGNRGSGKSGKNNAVGFANEAEVNRILDKIAQVGYQNLTNDEREILFKASKE
jgi:membrane associated rhomboid family serine protease